MANIIQGRFEHETDELQRKQAWYKANQGSLTREDETEYISQCNEAMFRIHILEQRLNRWEEEGDVTSGPVAKAFHYRQCERLWVGAPPVLPRKGFLQSLSNRKRLQYRY